MRNKLAFHDKCDRRDREKTSCNLESRSNGKKMERRNRSLRKAQTDSFSIVTINQQMGLIISLPKLRDLRSRFGKF